MSRRERMARNTGSLFEVSEDKQAPYICHSLEIVFDGGCAGPGAHAYGSYVIWFNKRQVAHERKEFGQGSTSNIGEWSILLCALEHAASLCDPSCTEVSVKGDSALVVHGAARRWKVKAPHLRPIAEQVWSVADKFGSISFTWWGRENSVQILGH